MRVRNVFVCVSLAMVVVLAFLAEPVTAKWMYGAHADGVTEITTSSCNATITKYAPYSLDIDNGDDVTIFYNVTWDDRRSPNSPDAIHNFTMYVHYPNIVTFQVKWKEVTTNGLESDTDSLNITVDNVQEDFSIYVTWSASLTSTSPLCSPSAWDDAGILLT